MNEEAEKSESAGGIQSLDAALRMLMTMSRLEGAVGLSELARACDMPASKTHRYLASFIHAGLVRQNGRSGTYDLAAGAIELGLAAMHRHDFVNAAADDLADLTGRTGLTSLLCVWGNSGPTVVRWQRARSLIVTSLGLGTTLPLLTSATGHVCLAFLPDRVTRDLLEEELRGARRSGSAETILEGMTLDRRGVAALAASVRARGHATVDGRFIPGLVAAAAPILDWQGEAQATVTLIGTDKAAIEPGAEAIHQLCDFCAGRSFPERRAIG
jgi:DNA-binding IclR family transcriptional regulator